MARPRQSWRDGRASDSKLQIPTNPKHQTPNSQTRARTHGAEELGVRWDSWIWDLEIAELKIGIWDLGFGAC